MYKFFFRNQEIIDLNPVFDADEHFLYDGPKGEIFKACIKRTTDLYPHLVSPHFDVESVTGQEYPERFKV